MFISRCKDTVHISNDFHMDVVAMSVYCQSFTLYVCDLNIDVVCIINENVCLCFTLFLVINDDVFL